MSDQSKKSDFLYKYFIKLGYLLIFYITYDDFYDDCIVDVRGIMTMGDLQLTAMIIRKNVLAEQSRAE